MMVRRDKRGRLGVVVVVVLLSVRLESVVELTIGVGRGLGVGKRGVASWGHLSDGGVVPGQ